MHATGRKTNVERRLATYVAGLTITGSPTVVLGSSGQHATGKIARVSVEFPGSEGWRGRLNGDRTYREALVLVVDLFWPSGEEAPNTSAYEISQAADDIRDAFTGIDISFLDYHADPSAPTTVADGRIYFDPPSRTARRFRDNFQHVRITVRGDWHAQDD